MDPTHRDPTRGSLPFAEQALTGLTQAHRDRPLLGPDSPVEDVPEAHAQASRNGDRPRNGRAENSRSIEELIEAGADWRDQPAGYRQLFEFAPVAYIVTDNHGVIEKTNQEVARLFGRPLDFLVGVPLPFLIAPEDRTRFYIRLIQTVSGNPTAPAEWEVRIQPRQGPPRDMAVALTVARKEGDRPPQLFWLLRDITERKVAEACLKGEREFSESLLELAEVLVLVVDRAGIIQRVNGRVQSLCDHTRAELLGYPWWEVITGPDDQARAHDEFVQALGGDGRWQGVFTLRGPGDVPVVIQWSGHPLGGAGAAAPMFLLVGHDITQLQQAQEHALRAERLASIGQVAAGLAHESRNALQRAQACLTLLRWKCQAQPEALDLIDRLARAQADLHHLYEDIREYAAPIRLECQSCDVSQVWREVWNNVAATHAGRSLQLKEITSGADLRLVADTFRLGQVFRNILENAVQAGASVVQIQCRDGTLRGQPALCVSVRDDGPGLGPEQRQHLFEPLYTTKTRGSGLGMAIVKRIIEAHGGEVGLGAGPGAEILFILPRSHRS